MSSACIRPRRWIHRPFHDGLARGVRGLAGSSLRSGATRTSLGLFWVCLSSPLLAHHNADEATFADHGAELVECGLTMRMVDVVRNFRQLFDFLRLRDLRKHRPADGVEIVNRLKLLGESTSITFPSRLNLLMTYRSASKFLVDPVV
jgi:hypothetical protein